MGYVVYRLNPDSNPIFQLLKGLNHFGIDIVYDVGANVGQFSSELRSVGYQGTIISFEPLSDAHTVLSQTAKNDAKWIVYQKGAIGDRIDDININISRNSVSSSVLPMLDSHSSAADDSSYVGVEKVPMVTLDSVVPKYLDEFKNPFLKIDTQGYEWEVLDGASEVLSKIKGILCEVSLVPLYEGQHLWREMIERLEGEGFTIWSIQQGFRDKRDGRTLQLDVIFFRIPD